MNILLMSEMKICRMVKYFASGIEFVSVRTASALVTKMEYKSDYASNKRIIAKKS
jgi:hypothetical protein